MTKAVVALCSAFQWALNTLVYIQKGASV